MQNAGSRTRHAGLNLRDVSRTLSAATQSPRLQKSILSFAVILLAMAVFAAQHAGAATLNGRSHGHRTHAHRQAAPDAGLSAGDLIHRWEPFITEAADKFSVPAEWIRAVMTRESGGRTGLVSRAGAVGLMQLMPATYAEMRREFRLGANCFDPHDNILAATAYLRFLNQKYGVAGMFAAYNAGPATYERSLAGHSLPAETQAYVQRVSVQLGDPSIANPSASAAGATATASAAQEGATRVTNTYVATASNAAIPVAGPPQPPTPPLVVASVTF